MADWRELPAGPALDRLIAERLGYTVRRVNWTPASSADFGYAYFLYSPEGEQAAFGDLDPDKAWLVVSNELDRVHVPHYSTDLNAAVTLADVQAEVFRFRLIRVMPDWWCCEMGLNPGDAEAYAATPALAICRAFLLVKGEG